MFPSGVCQLTDTRYAKTIQFQDITYQLAQEEDQAKIFDLWCAMLNSFDPSVQYQLTFVNRTTSEEQIAAMVHVPTASDDNLNHLRKEFSDNLRAQAAKGNNGIYRVKYLTFSLEEKNEKDAISRLERTEIDLCAAFKRLGVSAKALDGKAYLEVLYSILNIDNKRPFRFDWAWLPISGLSTKDYIAPSSFEFRSGREFRMGEKYCKCSFLQILAPELEDRILTEFLEMNNSLVMSMHIRQLDPIKAIKEIKHKITDLDATRINEQKKAVRAGYDMDILPSDLLTYGEDAKTVLRTLQSRNEKMFLVTIILMNVADSRRQLKSMVLQASTIAQRYNCAMTPLDFMQEQGVMSCLPLAQRQVPITRGLPTGSTAIFIPFTTQELFQDSPDALFYGVNALSHNLIMADRKQLKTPSGLILGTPGSGKSMTGKQEILNVILTTKDDVMICDPEGEYAPLVNRLNGQTIHISASSDEYINPLDINMDYNEDEDPVKLKAEFIFSFFEQIVGRSTGLDPEEISAIDQCTRKIYQPYLDDPRPENLPILEDMQAALMKVSGTETLTQAAQYLASVLDIYVNGTMNVFNHRTNVDVGNRLVCFDIKSLGKQLKKLGLLIVEDHIWNRVSANRSENKKTWIYFDEFHLILKDEKTASFAVDVWKRFRKYGGIPTGLTQNVKDLLLSKQIENILDTSDFIVMLNQYGDDRAILAQHLNISEHQLSYVTQADVGEGLLFYGNVIIPFSNRLPTDTEMYRLMTTKPGEAA